MALLKYYFLLTTVPLYVLYCILCGNEIKAAITFMTLSMELTPRMKIMLLATQPGIFKNPFFFIFFP